MRRSVPPPATRVLVPQLEPDPVSSVVPRRPPGRLTPPAGRSSSDMTMPISNACMQRGTRSRASCVPRGRRFRYRRHRHQDTLRDQPTRRHRHRAPIRVQLTHPLRVYIPLHQFFPSKALIINISFRIKILDCVIGRRRITIQPSPSGIAKTIILKPIDQALSFRGYPEKARWFSPTESSPETFHS